MSPDLDKRYGCRLRDPYAEGLSVTSDDNRRDCYVTCHGNHEVINGVCVHHARRAKQHVRFKING